LSAALLALWLVLARSVSPGHLLLGFSLALIVPPLTASLRPTNVRVRRPLVILRYILQVGFDVVRACFEVAWGVVARGKRRPQSRFVVIPLDLRDPVGLAALAMVTTVVPGTVWSELALDHAAVRLHVWDAGDEHAFIAHYKARYETPLREIFE
jgi:multicomponent K+:H+ antiporter subunit E